MTIRLKYHLALLPLFLGITVVNIGCYWLLEARELAWGVTQQAQSRAIALAALLPLHAGHAAGRALAIDRFSRQAGGLSVASFELRDGQWRREPLTQGADLPLVPVPDAGVLADLQTRPAVARGITFPEFEFDEVTAYAGLHDASGRLSAMVGVMEKDVIVRAEVDWLVTSSFIFAAAVMLGGFIVTEFLTRRAQRDIAAVTAGAEALGRGEYDHAWPENTVQELEDLSGTLRSIGRILADGVQRTRRRLLRAQQLPGEDEIAAAFRQRFGGGAAAGPDSGVPHVVCHVGGGCPSDFFGVRQEGSRWHAAAGRLQSDAEARPRLESYVRATAARDYVLGRLVAAPTKAWAELDAVFPSVCGESASVELPGGTVRLQTHGVDRGALPPPTGVGVLGTLDAEAMLTAREYVARFPHRPLEALARDLVALYPERHCGVLLLFRVAAPTA